MRNKKDINYLSFSVILFVIFLILFHIVRSDNAIATYDYYKHVLNVKEFSTLNQNISINNVQDFVISQFDNSLLIMQILPFLFGLINTYLIYLVIKQVTSNKHHILGSITYLALSPIYLYTHLIYNETFISLSLLLLGAYFIIKNRFLFGFISLISGFVLNPYIFVTIIFVLLLLFEKGGSRRVFVTVIGFVSIVALFILVSKSSLADLSFQTIITHYIADFGALKGLGFFGILLAIVGLIVSWTRKKVYSIVYLMLFCTLLVSLYNLRLLIYLELILAFFSGLGFSALINRKWESNLIKNYVILLIFCGLIFSAGSSIKSLSETGPNDEEILSLKWLNDNSNHDLVVLSHYNYGFMIKSISGNQVFVDGDYYETSLDKTKINEIMEIFSSRDFNKITSFLSKNNIKYIWINNAMKTGLVWNEEDEGLLLILRNSNSFQRIYNYQCVEIFEFNEH